MHSLKAMFSMTAAVLLALGLAACSEERTAESDPGQVNAATQPPASAEPGQVWYTDAQVRQGRPIYNNNCANCHGAMAQGARNWRQRGPDGNFPAPPLNGSGHTWHHPMPVLERVIREGGPANMPAWGHTLSDAEIKAVLAYVQSLWPEEIYNTWAERMERARQQG